MIRVLIVIVVHSKTINKGTEIAVIVVITMNFETITIRRRIATIR